MNLTTTACEPDHHCPICQRFVPKLEVDILGRVRIVQPKCQCETAQYQQEITAAQEYEQKRRIEQKFSICNLGARFAECTFETFKQREGTDKVLSNALTYVNKFDEIQEEGLLIWGKPGNGKSHLSAAVAHSLKASGKTVVFQTVPELLERIRNTFNSHEKESEKDIMAALLQCDLLILDDIGSEKISDWVLDVLYRIVDGRYRGKKPICYTSNLKPSELKHQLNEKIYDRMIETSIIIENQGTSYRREIGKQRFERLIGE